MRKRRGGIWYVSKLAPDNGRKNDLVGPQSIHGFDRTLRLTATRREDFDMEDVVEVDSERHT